MISRFKLHRAAGKVRDLGRRLLGRCRPVIVGYRRRRLALAVRHVSGRKAVDYSPEELVVTCVVRNGSSYLRRYVNYYQKMGVKHIVFLDNGSTDDTLALASAFPDVTVLRVDLPYSRYENLMKDYLAKRFSTDRWNLCADIDELFDYPGSDRMPLGSFLRYLNERGFTAVVAQMLDMFSDAPLAGIVDDGEKPLEEIYRYYDTSNIAKSEYRWSELSSADVKMHHGGIRKTMFGTNNGLTKAALVFVGPGVKLFRDWHHAENAQVADLTCVLLHYPFNGSFFAKVREAAASKRYGYFTSDEYERYWRRLSAEPDLTFPLAGAQRYAGTSALLDEGFLVASPRYLDWARSQAGSR